MSGISIFLATLALLLGLAAEVWAQTAPSLDPNGWTVFTPSADTRTIYVSSSTGNDLNSGLFASVPVKTIAMGLSLLRNGYPDWLLLKKGDTWTDERFGFLALSGRSATEPMLFSAYGTGARPLIKTNGVGATVGIGSKGGTDTNGNYASVVGIEFYAYTRDPNSPSFDGGISQEGAIFNSPMNWGLIEDCKFSFYSDNIVVQGFGSDRVNIRRNVIVDSYDNSGGHSQGIYAAHIPNLLVEENILDHNGWNESIAGAQRTIFNHGMYLNYDNGPLAVRGNIIAQSSSEGLQARSGGIVSNNLLVRNAVGFDLGHSKSDGGILITTGIATNNVVLQSDDINASTPRGGGINVIYASGSGIQVTNNIVAHEASDFSWGIGMNIDFDSSGVTVINNIVYQWDNPIIDQGTGDIVSPNAINLTGYLDPNRTVDTYDATLGGPGTLANFLTLARSQSKDNWNTALMANAVNAYIQAGFGVASPSKHHSHQGR
jgi:hypothetical protein